jgi:alpha/beta superfamily hydrolase
MNGERVQSVEIQGPSGVLEGLVHVDLDRPPTALAVVCHPHPLYGGNMHNKVVHRLDRALFRAGYTTLRFNFRGVGASAGRWGEGVGERDDTRAAVEEMFGRHPGLPMAIAGFSFGAGRAAELAMEDERIQRLICVGSGQWVPDALAEAPQRSLPILLVHGERDVVAPLAPIERWVTAHPGRAKLVVIPNADHFFAESLDALEQVLDGFLAASAGG